MKDKRGKIEEAESQWHAKQEKVKVTEARLKHARVDTTKTIVELRDRIAHTEEKLRTISRMKQGLLE